MNTLFALFNVILLSKSSNIIDTNNICYSGCRDCWSEYTHFTLSEEKCYDIDINTSLYSVLNYHNNGVLDTFVNTSCRFELGTTTFETFSNQTAKLDYQFSFDNICFNQIKVYANYMDDNHNSIGWCCIDIFGEIVIPTGAPTKNPTTNPTSFPTKNPTKSPTNYPTLAPTPCPTTNLTLECPIPNFTLECPSYIPTHSPSQCIISDKEASNIDDDDFDFKNLGWILFFSLLGFNLILLIYYLITKNKNNRVRNNSDDSDSVEDSNPVQNIIENPTYAKPYDN